MKVDPVTLLQMEDHRINIQPVIEVVVIMWVYNTCVLHRCKGVLLDGDKLINKPSARPFILDNNRHFIGQRASRPLQVHTAV